MPQVSVAAPSDLATNILFVRGQRVLLDETLAALYSTTISAFNQAVRRNRERFPVDFLIELNPQEWEILRYEAILGLMGSAPRKN